MPSQRSPQDPINPPRTPVLCLEAARHRLRPGARAVDVPAPLAVLQEALRCGRLDPADVFAMVRLGILTDAEGPLPCADPHRKGNAHDWEHASLAQGDAGPPSQVGCPLMAQAATGGVAPACIEVLQVQAQVPRWVPAQRLGRGAPDPEDPVVRSGLRPCRLLGGAVLGLLF